MQPETNTAPDYLAESPFIGKFYKLRLSPADSEIFGNLCRMIKKNIHVHKIHYLIRSNEKGYWLYIIQTSFATTPNFILGRVDDTGENIEPLAASITLEALTLRIQGQ